MKALIVLCMLITLPLTLAGCMSATYKDPKTGAELTIQKFAWETKIGHLEATNGESKIVVENYDSTSQAIQLAEQAVKLVGAATAAAPK